MPFGFFFGIVKIKICSEENPWRFEVLFLPFCAFSGAPTYAVPGLFHREPTKNNGTQKKQESNATGT